MSGSTWEGPIYADDSGTAERAGSVARAPGLIAEADSEDNHYHGNTQNATDRGPA